MAEIKTEVLKLEEGKSYTASYDEYLITERHNLSDILRFVVGQAGDDVGHIMALLETLDITQEQDSV